MLGSRGFIIGMLLVLAACIGGSEGASHLNHEPLLRADIGILVVCAMFVLAAVSLFIASIVGDYFYNKRVDRGEAEYRLPFWKRWGGWEIGRLGDEYFPGIDGINRVYYDKRFQKEVPIYFFGRAP